MYLDRERLGQRPDPLRCADFLPVADAAKIQSSAFNDRFARIADAGQNSVYDRLADKPAI
jgi:hypothetical protein